jgi:F-type H+-transporting ATPase subunit b
MQREELYRSRLDDVRTEVKRRLDYQLQLEGLEKTFQQRHLVSWLEDSVRESVTTKPVRHVAYSKSVICFCCHGILISHSNNFLQL